MYNASKLTWLLKERIAAIQGQSKVREKRCGALREDNDVDELFERRKPQRSRQNKAIKVRMLTHLHLDYVTF